MEHPDAGVRAMLLEDAAALSVSALTWLADDSDAGISLRASALLGERRAGQGPAEVAPVEIDEGVW